jgi:hypothetical protein
MAALELALSPAEVDELLAFMASALGPIGAPPAYLARLVAYFRNNFDAMFRAEVIGLRTSIELTPRGERMLFALPPHRD